MHRMHARMCAKHDLVRPRSLSLSRALSIMSLVCT